MFIFNAWIGEIFILCSQCSHLITVVLILSANILRNGDKSSRCSVVACPAPNHRTQVRFLDWTGYMSPHYGPWQKGVLWGTMLWNTFVSCFSLRIVYQHLSQWQQATWCASAVNGCSCCCEWLLLFCSCFRYCCWELLMLELCCFSCCQPPICPLLLSPVCSPIDSVAAANFHPAYLVWVAAMLADRPFTMFTLASVTESLNQADVKWDYCLCSCLCKLCNSRVTLAVWGTNWFNSGESMYYYVAMTILQ